MDVCFLKLSHAHPISFEKKNSCCIMKRISPDTIRMLMLFFASITGFFALSYFSNLAYDDFNYKFMYDQFGLTSHRVVSLTDIFVSQYHHYFIFAGRVIVHFFVQLFLIPDSKIWFDLANSAIFGCFMILILLNSSYLKKTITSSVVLVLIIFIWYLVTGQNYCMFWLSGSVNYMWSVSASLLLLLINKKLVNDNSPKTYNLVVIFVAAFFLNSLHEVISISISIALILELIVFGNFRNKSLISLNLGAFLGALFIGLAPSNFIRLAIVSSTAHNDLQNVIAADDSHLLIILNATKIFFILGVLLLLVYFNNKKLFVKIIRQNFVFIVSIVVSFLFVYVVKGFNQRAIFPAVIYALVILLSIVAQFNYILTKKSVKIALILILISMVAEYSTVLSGLRANKKAFVALDATLRHSNANETLFQLPQLEKNRFVCFTGFGSADRFCVPNMGISRLYSKPFVIFLMPQNYSELNRISKLSYPNDNRACTILFTLQHTAFIQLPASLKTVDLTNLNAIVKFNSNRKPIKHDFSYGTLNNRIFIFFSVPKDLKNGEINQVLLLKNENSLRQNNPYK